MQDQALDDVDLQLLNALQIHPRASWTSVGTVLGVDPVTLARRWEHIRAAGVAWVTGYPVTTATAAIVEVEAQPGRLLELAHTLGDDPEAMTIDITSGARDLVVTAVGRTEQALSRYLLERLEGLDSVAKVRSHPVAGALRDASAWRLRSLDPRQVDALRPPESRARGRRSNHVDVIVKAELAQDGRITATAIAQKHGLNVRRVRESISEVLDSGQMRLRTEIVRSLSGWPICAWYFLSVPAAQTARVGDQLKRIEEIRTVMSVVGRYNIAMAVWMRTIADVSRLEASIEQQLPNVRIIDRSVVMRTTKLVGNLLDEHGRATRWVPISAG